MGLRVVAIETGGEKKALCEKLGAAVWIDFKGSENIVKDVLAATGGKGAKAALMISASVSKQESQVKSLNPIGRRLLIIKH